MRLRVVLVEPEHDLNVGSVARVMKNFGAVDLVLVRPKCSVGFEAKKYAKHSEEVLQNARIVKTMRQAAHGCDIVVGTSGVVERFSDRLKNTISLPKLPKVLEGAENVALVFGSESRGIPEEDMLACDVVATIPANPAHPVFNLSHAVAVVLYELRRAGGGELANARKPAEKKHRELLEMELAKLAGEIDVVKDPKKVANAFRNIIERARPTPDEVQAALAIVGPMRRMAAGRKRKKKA